MYRHNINSSVGYKSIRTLARDLNSLTDQLLTHARIASMANDQAPYGLIDNGAVALREHDDLRGDGPDDGVDVFQGYEVAMGLAMLDYPVDQQPFTRNDLKHAYEEHLLSAGPRVFGNLQAH